MSIPYFYQEVEQIYIRSIARGAQTLAVCATTAGQGASSLVCALAQRAKAAGINVLVVDLNLFDPFALKRMRRSEKLTELLLMTTPVDEVTPLLPGELVFDKGPNIPALTLSNRSEIPVCLRDELILKTMIDGWLVNHDLVLFDTSPLCQVNRHNIPAQTVCACADGTILVVQPGKIERHQLQQAMASLQATNANLLGTVMNDHNNPTLGSETATTEQKITQALAKCDAMVMQQAANQSFAQCPYIKKCRSVGLTGIFLSRLRGMKVV